MGLVAPTGTALLVDAHNRPIASSAPPAPKPAELPTEAFLCRAHGRFFQRRKVQGHVVRDALVVMLLRNKRLGKVIGKAERDGISFAQVVAALEQVRPWCCYLSAPERLEVVRIGTKGHAYVAQELAAMRERAFTRDLVRRSELLAIEYHVPVDVAAHALEQLAGRDAALVNATLATVASLPGADRQRQAIDDLASKL